MGRRAKDNSSALIRAAKRLIDDDENHRPLAKEEAKVMAQTRQELPRPSKKEIEEMAVKLLRQN